METHALRITDPLYPVLLKQIQNPPDPLYVRGTILPDEPCFTVVGTRKPTAYGREAAKHFTTQLCQAGFTIVSGLAFGIDAIAHETALEQGSRTIAVLGSGPDVITPITNEQLGRRIAECGALVSEFPAGTQAQKFHFPLRDRIMAGLSLGTLVIEAGYKSGALITARNATEQGREVFVVPGPIFSPASQGANKLIQDGAKLVTDIADILEELPESFRATARARASRMANDAERKILASLTEPKTLDEIVGDTDMAAADARAALTMLELKRAVIKQDDEYYRKK